MQLTILIIQAILRIQRAIGKQVVELLQRELGEAVLIARFYYRNIFLNLMRAEKQEDERILNYVQNAY